MSRPFDPAHAAFVLVEPLFEGNVGACARALKNCGFSGLRLVRPPVLGDDARRMACGSQEVLDQARRLETLDDAIADAHLVAGFTARDRRDLRDPVPLAAAAPMLAEAAVERRIALVFGREDRGLTNAELDACQVLVRIPAAEERLVYNLSQAVLLAAYELRRAAAAPSPSPPLSTGQPLPQTLPAAARRHLQRRIRGVLEILRYPEHPDPGLLERIVYRADRLLDRAGVDASDLAMLLGVIRRVEQLAGKPREKPGPR